MKKNKEEIYISIDIETNGPIPGLYSMLSLGAVALTKTGEELGTFSVNLETLPGAGEDPNTMEWWKSQPNAWAACHVNPQDPEKGMKDFTNWLLHFIGRGYSPTLVAAPSGFDFMFVYWYAVRFTGRMPTGFKCIDMRSYVMSHRNTDYNKTSKSFWAKRWFPNNVHHTHIALDDAREQGYAFVSILNENNLPYI